LVVFFLLVFRFLDGFAEGIDSRERLGRASEVMK
jgi:hypothetical protein